MSRDLTATRARLEAGMADTCRITRLSRPPTYNSTTGNLTPAAPHLVYDGACLVTEVRRAGPREVGGEQEYRSPYQVSVPIDAGVFQIGDLVTVTVCAADTELVDRILVVESIAYGSNVARRRLLCRLSNIGPIV
jgi:hypothetical protein